MPERATCIGTLSLTDNGLKDIPSWIFEINALLILEINSNPISKIPPEIDRLRGLQTLRIEYTNIRYIPSGFSNLISLTHLSFKGTRFTTAPREVFELSRLKVLDLSFCGHNEENFLEELTNLQGLDELNLESTRFKRLPSTMGSLGRLRSLHLIACDLFELPSSFSCLVSLTHLDVCSNRFTSLNSLARNLRSLNTLRADYNMFSKLEDWEGTPYLEKLRLNNVPSIIEWKGPQLLTDLSLQSSNIGVIPKWALNRTVTYLCASQINLPSLPQELGEQVQLRKLDLSANSFVNIELIGRLVHLQFLYLSANNINVFPKIRLPYIQYVDLENNKITALSRSILDLNCEVCLKGNAIEDVDLYSVTEAFGNGFKLIHCTSTFLYYVENLKVAYHLTALDELIGNKAISKWITSCDDLEHQAILVWLSKLPITEQQIIMKIMERASNEPTNIRSAINQIILDLKVRSARKSCTLEEEAKLYAQEYAAVSRDATINTDYMAAADIVLNAFQKPKSQE